MIEALRVGIATAPGRVLVIEDGSSQITALSSSLLGVATRWVLDGPALSKNGPWGGVALLVRDRQGLRRAVSVLPDLGRSAFVWCWVQDCGGWAPSLVVRPEWPRLKSLNVRTQGSGLAAAEFAARAPVREVLIGIARGSSSQRNLWPGQPSLAATSDRVGLWLPASPDARTGHNVESLVLGDWVIDADAVVVEHADGPHPEAPAEADSATGRPVQLVSVGRMSSWRELCGNASLQSLVGETGLNPLSVPPVDEHVINPMGFERDWSQPVVQVEATLGNPDAVTLRLPTGPRVIDLREGLKDSDVKLLRKLEGLDVRWRGGHGPQAYARLVAALAMAGVPMVTTVVPQWAASLLDPDLVGELSAPASLDDRFAREERSLRLRRAALRTHSISGWRRRVAVAGGLPQSRLPKVSIILATRRPEMVDFALRQIARQRHAGGEVMLAAHGFEVDASMTRALDGVHQWQLQVLSVDRTVPFGAVLNRAAERASGDVLLKMDDDDWYGPEFVSDLLLARGYSGADIVGMLAEFSFIESLWLTVRRPDLTECYNTFVAGGTLMIDRTTFADVGGFRPLRHFVDAGLLAAVREGGGSIYRTQGLGYLLRRGKGGHTWDPGMGYFIAAARVSAQWHGFRPCAELAVEPRDCPQRATDDRHLMAGERS